MFGVGLSELIIIVIVALIFIGPDKLPQLARTLGKAFSEFRRAGDEVKKSFREASEPGREGVPKERDNRDRTAGDNGG